MHARPINKLIAIVITAAALLALPISAAAQETVIPSVTFDPSTLTAKPSDQLTVDVVVNHATSGNVLHLVLNADGNAQFSTINEASGYLAVDKQISTTSLQVDLAKTSGNFTEGEVVAQLVFTVNAEGTARISVSSDTKFGAQSSAQTSLEVTVSNGATTTETPTSPAATATTPTSSTSDIVVIGLVAAGVIVLLLMLVLWIKLIRKSSPKGPTWA